MSSAAPPAVPSSIDFTSTSLPIQKFFPEGTEFRYNKRKGRHVVSTKDFPSGSLFFSAPAYACVVSDPFVTQRCHQCFQTAPTMYVCSKCEYARFCSTSCKNSMANVHLRECAALKEFGKIGFEGESAPVRLVIRILNNRKHEREQLEKNADKSSGKSTVKDKKEKLSSPVFVPSPGFCSADSSALLAHQEKFDPQNVLTMKLILSRLEAIMNSSQAWTNIDEATQIFFQIHCNAHQITTLEEKYRIGLGLYLPAAYLNHSCLPSCVYSYSPSSSVMEMRLICPLSSGGEFTYSYIDLYQSRAARQKILQEIFFIDSCYCQRCNDSKYNEFDRYLDGIICGNCGENSSQGKSIIEKKKKEKSDAGDWKPGIFHCPQCKTVYSPESIQEFQQQQASILRQAQEFLHAEEFLEAAKLLEEKFLGKSSRAPFFSFHPYNSQSFHAYSYLIAIWKHEKQYLQQEHYISLQIICMEKAEFFNHPELGNAYQAMAEIRMIRAKQSIFSPEEIEKASTAADGAPLSPVLYLLNLVLSNFQKSMEIRDLAYGKKHSLTQESIKGIIQTQEEIRFQKKK